MFFCSIRVARWSEADSSPLYALAVTRTNLHCSAFVELSYLNYVYSPHCVKESSGDVSLRDSANTSCTNSKTPLLVD